jgi:hypothetical protein
VAGLQPQFGSSDGLLGMYKRQAMIGMLITIQSSSPAVVF